MPPPSMAGPKSHIKRFNLARICDLGPIIEKGPEP